VRLIRYSLLIFVCLLIAYELAFRVLDRERPFAENQWIRNFIIAQQYIYDRQDSPVVIVGSSLSRRLRGDLLPSEVFNLSLGGLSAFDGINIVLRADTRPKAIYIETNVLTRDSSPDFEDRLLRPGLYTLRRWIISLRDEGRSLTVGGTILCKSVESLFRTVLGVSALKRICPAPSPQESATSPKEGATKMFDQLLLLQTLQHQAALTDKQRDRLAAELTTAIDTLVKRGINVVFFELPINPELCELPLLPSIRSLLRSQFPNQKYVRVADCNGVRTTDGIHLSGEESETVTRQFAKILDQTTQ